MPTFPFTAVVGADDLALSLCLSAVSPAIGGVLVRGEKGTAKSTMVRALAGLLPEVEVVAGCRFSCDPADPDQGCPDGPHRRSEGVRRPARLVELPVGASEDRVIGSLHLQRALSEGVTEYDPGLLAAAHRGLLYVDEVNLLHDHLVDLLLDAAAMGRSTVEREGVSIAHAAQFVLVGTMNPEEGELRPQLLDRFGLTVAVRAPRDPALRSEVVRRRLAFDADPDAFFDRFAADEAALADRIRQARKRLPDVALTDWATTAIATVCAGFEVDGMRADIVTARAALAHAAWFGRGRVTKADVRAAALLALPHRRRRNPFDAPGLDTELLDRLLDDLDPEPPAPQPDPPTEPESDDEPAEQPDAEPQEPGPPRTPPSAEADESAPSAEAGESAPPQEPSLPEPSADRTPAGGAGAALPAGRAGDPFRTRLLAVTGIGAGQAGRRSPALTSLGRTVGARKGPGPGPLHLTATIRAAAPRQAERGRESGRLRLAEGDLRLAVRQGKESNLVLFCVDASGSMAARRRMDQVKTAVLSLLMDAYQRRDKVALISFRGAGAELALPATSSVDVAAARLDGLPVGGRTPLAAGLLLAAETLRLEAIRDPQRRPLVVLVTDGRATAGPDAVARAARAAELLIGRAVVVVDCETGRFRLGLARRLAESIGAQHLPVDEVAAELMTALVRGRLRDHPRAA